jgi:ketosteroid isomerase-like protein
MSQANVALVRAAYDAWRRTGRPPIDGLARSFKSYDPPDAPDPRIYHGPEGLLDQLHNVEQAFDELRWDAEEYVEHDDRVVVVIRMSGRGKESAVDVSMHVFHVWKMLDREAVELRILFSREQALEAAGMSARNALADP